MTANYNYSIDHINDIIDRIRKIAKTAKIRSDISDFDGTIDELKTLQAWTSKSLDHEIKRAIKITQAQKEEFTLKKELLELQGVS